MTTIAMAAGMAPSALAIGAGGEFRSPMAIAVIGGLIASTLLSLLFVPAFFTVMDDVGRLSWRMFGRLIGPSGETPHPAGSGQSGRTADGGGSAPGAATDAAGHAAAHFGRAVAGRRPHPDLRQRRQRDPLDGG